MGGALSAIVAQIGVPPLQPLWMLALVLALLGLAALIDARRGIVPDPLIALGFAVLGAGLLTDGQAQAVSGVALRGAAAYAAVWSVNRLWRMGSGHDALGMGDAKWTALAVGAFGWHAGLAAAWGIGAVVASLVMMIGHGLRRPVAHIRFAPYLMLGLLFGLWWDYGRML